MNGHVKMMFKLNLVIMRLLGFYPPLRFKEIYKLYAYAVYVCFTIPVPVLAAVHLIISSDVDMAEVGDNSFVIFECGCFIFKLIPFIFNVEEIRKTIYMLEWPVFNNYTEEQEVIIQECVTTCTRNTRFFLGAVLLAFLSWAASPFVRSDQDFPITIWVPFCATVDTKTYVAVFLFIFLGIGNGAIASAAADLLVSGMAYFATTQLRILKDNLENLSKNANAEIRKENLSASCLKNKIIYSRIKSCINHHTAILKFIQHYEKVYSLVAFAQFMASAIVICVSCLQLSMVQPFTFTFFQMISFLLALLSEIFLYSYFGSTLFEESNTLTTAIYMSEWYEYDLKSKKALIVLMERSKKPIVITAGKILDLSLVTFMTILRRAYSLLAVLKNYEVEI